MSETDEVLAEVRRWLCDNLSDGDAGKVCGMLSMVSRRIVEIEAENAKLQELVVLQSRITNLMAELLEVD